MSAVYPYLCAGEWRESPEKLQVLNPYSGEVVGTTSVPTAEDAEAAVRAAVQAFAVTRRLPAHERSALLHRIAAGVETRREEIARTIAAEAGKPIRDARAEVGRALLTLHTAAEEALRLGGEFLPLDLLPQVGNRYGIVRRVPLGPVLAITPFNFPLNLAAHKVGPAIAAGNPLVLKLPSAAPLTMLTVAQIIADSGLPRGAITIFPLGHAATERIVGDDRLRALTFTGSSAVGWALKAKAGKKRVLLELGGNAGVIVDEGAVLPYAVRRIVQGAFAYAGQSCIAVQRIYVHEPLEREFTSALCEAAEALVLGDPLDEATELGPMIDAGAAERTAAWVQEAVAAGARILTGGHARDHNLFEPTVLAAVPLGCKVVCEEVFAPVVALFPFGDIREALRGINDSPYGLQAGIFTGRLEHALLAFEELEVGGVIVNDVPTWRIDPMPYGGVKDSGLGREGIRYALEELTERRLLVVNRSVD